MRTTLLVALACFPACAPRLYVNVLQPAPVNLGAARKLTVVESQGRRSAREAVIQELANQTRASGYFTFTDRSEDGITVKVAGRTVQVTGGQPQAPDEARLRLDVLEWSADKETRKSKDSKGKEITREVWVGRVLVQVTAFSAAGKTFVSEKEYQARHEDERDEDTSIVGAARLAVTQLLRDITPEYVQKAIRLDDDDEAQRPIIELARNGSVPEAIDRERGLVEKSPNNPAAVYNLAVLLDSQGLYKEALPLYEQAIRLSAKPFYVEMKNECARRLADAEALAN